MLDSLTSRLMQPLNAPWRNSPRVICGEQEAILQARLEAAPDATVLERSAWWGDIRGGYRRKQHTYRADEEVRLSAI